LSSKASEPLQWLNGRAFTQRVGQLFKPRSGQANTEKNLLLPWLMFTI